MPQVLQLMDQALGQQQVPLFFGQVSAPAPTAFSSALNVVIPDIDDTFVWSLAVWPQSHGTTLPAVGGSVLVCFDNRRNPWVLCW